MRLSSRLKQTPCRLITDAPGLKAKTDPRLKAKTDPRLATDAPGFKAKMEAYY